jgi:hypothetical protein
MHYIIGVMAIIMMVAGGFGYWYYQDSQDRIATLQHNNAELTIGIETNEQTITALQEDYALQQQIVVDLNTELRDIQRRNQFLVDKFADSDLGVAAAAKPELIERLINRGTANAFRCFELLSGAALNEKERNATNATEFNNECPWIFNDSSIR